MSNRCLYCYQELEEGQIHPRYSRAFFGTDKPPRLDYNLEQMADLAANVVQRSVTVPGVQPKLSLTLVREVVGDGSYERLTIVGTLGGNYILKPPHADYPEMPRGLAPAYDLLNVAIVNPADKEELALTINARRSKFNRARFVEFGLGMGLTARQIEGVFNRLLRNEKSALDLIKVSFLSEEYKEKYAVLLTERYDHIRK